MRGRARQLCQLQFTGRNLVQPHEIRAALERILPGVQKPGRYLGLERNRVLKDWGSAAVRLLLAFPDEDCDAHTLRDADAHRDPNAYADAHAPSAPTSEAPRVRGPLSARITEGPRASRTGRARPGCVHLAPPSSVRARAPRRRSTPESGRQGATVARGARPRPPRGCGDATFRGSCIRRASRGRCLRCGCRRRPGTSRAFRSRCSR
jgi:hypothetical protein